jgi:hypothetical protein
VSQNYPSRYLHISGAFAVSGTFTRIAPDVDIHMQVPTIAPVHLPMVGGTSEARHKKVSVDCRTAKFGKIDRKLLRQLQKKEILSVGAAYSLARTEPEVQGQPFQSNSVSEVKSVRIAEGFFLKYGLLNLQSSHDPNKSRHPSITFGKTEITGLKLGKSTLKITLDLDTFNKYPTLDAFEAAFQNDAKLREKLSPRFVTDPRTGGLHKNASGYVVGSIVQKVEGLPDDARLDGFVITWPKFGKIILGEILMGPYVRRVTLVRFKHSDGEVGSGCSGGSTYP